MVSIFSTGFKVGQNPSNDKVIQKFELALKIRLNLAKQIVVDGEGAKISYDKCN